MNVVYLILKPRVVTWRNGRKGDELVQERLDSESF